MSSLFPLLPLLFALLATPVHAAPPTTIVTTYETFDDPLGELPSDNWYSLTGSSIPEVEVIDTDCGGGDKCLGLGSSGTAGYANFDTGDGNFDACAFGASFGVKFRTPTSSYVSSSSGIAPSPVIIGVSDHKHRTTNDGRGPFEGSAAPPQFVGLALDGHGSSTPRYSIHINAGHGSYTAESLHDPDTNLIADAWYSIEADVDCSDGSIHFTIRDADSVLVDDFTMHCASLCASYGSLNTLHLGGANPEMAYDNLFVNEVFGDHDAVSAATVHQATSLAADYAYNATVWVKDMGAGSSTENGRLYAYESDLTSRTDFSPCGAAGIRYAATANEPIAYSDGYILAPCRLSGNGYASLVWVKEDSVASEVHVTDLRDDFGVLGLSGTRVKTQGNSFDHIAVARAYNNYAFGALAGTDNNNCESSGGFIFTVEPAEHFNGCGDTAVIDLDADKMTRIYGAVAERFNDGSLGEHPFKIAPDATASPYACLNGTSLGFAPAKAVSVRADREYVYAHFDTQWGLIVFGLCGNDATPDKYGIASYNWTANILGDTVDSYLAMQLSPDGQYLAIVVDAAAGMVVRVYDTQTGVLLSKYIVSEANAGPSENPMAFDSANNYLYVLALDSRTYRFPLYAVTVSTGGDGADEDTPNPPALEATIPESLTPVGTNHTSGGPSGSLTGGGPAGGTGPLHTAITFCSDAWGFDCAVLFGLALIALIVMAFASYSTGSIVMLIATTLGFIIAFMLGLFPVWVLVLIFLLVAGFAAKGLFGGGQGDDE